MYKIKNYIPGVLFLIHFLATLFVSKQYAGSFSYLALFSISFCLFSILIYRVRSYLSLFFLGLMLWFGFWLKFIAHHVVKYPYLDFIGRFKGSGPEWDQVLLITSVGILGLSAALIKRAMNPAGSLEITKEKPKLIPSSKLIVAFFAVILAVVLTTAFLNLYWGVTLSGVTAIAVLPFKLNAISGWFLYLGFALVIAFFAKFEYSRYLKVPFSITLALIESLTSSFSLISRGQYLFHALPFLYITLLNVRNLKIKIRHLLIIAFVFCAFFMANSFLVTSARYRLYAKEILKVEPYNPKVLIEKSTYENKTSYTYFQIRNLIIDRWIGLEGVMSISTYPERSFELLKSTFLNKLKIGEFDVYVQISLSDYNQTMNYSFTSLPGIIAFLYYADNLFIVFFGMMFIGFLLLGIEFLVRKVFDNPFLSAQLGFYLAHLVAGFGVSPRPGFISLLMTVLFLVIAKLLMISIEHRLKPK